MATGALFQGKWVDEIPKDAKENGPFKDAITKDGRSGFAPEPGRYELYAAVACPFANRPMIMRRLKGLEAEIGQSEASPKRTDQGWEYVEGPSSTVDHANGKRYIHEIYTLAVPDYTGPASVPALFDRKTKKIVNNESADITRMLDTEYPGPDFYPEPLRAEVDKTISQLGFLLAAPWKLRGPEAGQIAEQLTAFLTTLNSRLTRQRYLVGDRLTEADVIAYTPLVRYAVLFGDALAAASVPRLSSFQHLFAYVRDLHQTKGFGDVVDVEVLRRAGGVVSGREEAEALLKPHGRG